MLSDANCSANLVNRYADVRQSVIADNLIVRANKDFNFFEPIFMQRYAQGCLCSDASPVAWAVIVFKIGA